MILSERETMKGKKNWDLVLFTSFCFLFLNKRLCIFNFIFHPANYVAGSETASTWSAKNDDEREIGKFGERDVMVEWKWEIVIVK